tara:strand:+ start:1336 stop:2016 length:681 start_codon:yes stop_codon:yes gene_type:complete
MSKNLVKRVFTSLVLILILFVCLNFNKYLWLLLIITASIICFFEFNNITKKIWKRKKTIVYLSNILSSIFLIFVIFSSYELYTSGSKLDIIFILLVCIFSDIGGYVVGKLVGGKKLTKISPKKTISGSIGSFIFSLLPIIMFLILQEYTKDASYKMQFSFINIIFLTLFLSFVCQVGDLIISYFKRKAKIKDTGSLLPGHGGLLDRIDGLIFVLPISMIVLKIFKI